MRQMVCRCPAAPVEFPRLPADYSTRFHLYHLFGPFYKFSVLHLLMPGVRLLQQ